jgi:hypothetical protein
MIKRIVYFILILYLLFDIGYSFIQNLNLTLDGDMAWNILPADDVKPVLNSPFGTDVLLKHDCYPNPNRFFCHWTIMEYFNTVPFYLQKFVQPIDSIYLSCAIFRSIVQIILIYLLAAIISGTYKIYKFDLILSAALITPLFQTNGYTDYMGVINLSTTYTFFYAFPTIFLLLYFLPFIFKYYHERKSPTKLLIKIFWIPLAIVISLSGPLNPGVALIVSFLLILNSLNSSYTQSTLFGFVKKGFDSIKRIPKNYWFYLVPIALFSLYSLYIGKNNSNNVKISLLEMYSRLPKGFYYVFIEKLAFPILFVIIILNVFLINFKYKTPEGEKILLICKWTAIFALIYILLLPFGGYREYRYYIIRSDTILPVTLSIFILFGITTLYTLKNITNFHKKWYIPLIIGSLFIYISYDKVINRCECERADLKVIAESKDKIVQLNNECTVVSWDTKLKPEDSELDARLLVLWKITKDKKLYFNKVSSNN